MTKLTSKDLISWYERERPTYESLGLVVAATLGAILKSKGLVGSNVSFRTKTVASFAEKLKRKGYANARSEMTDLAGIRVVTLVERDIPVVADAVKAAFSVHQEDSLDKGAELGVDRFGYRSIHIVCDLGPQRLALEELAPFKGIKFEIQIRTSLQHAWAEIEHDRGYKFAGALPSELKRRFHLLAGMLESADREFSELTQAIELYAAKAGQQLQNDAEKVELNATTINELFQALGLRTDSFGVDSGFVEELRDFGISNLAELRSILEPAIGEFDTAQGAVGFIRDAMMYQDIERYFAKAWQRRWHGWDDGSMKRLEDKYGQETIERIVTVYQPGFDFSDDSEELDAGDSQY